MMVSGESPSARLARITLTMTRRPLMHAFPWHTSALMLIRSCHFMAWLLLACSSMGSASWTRSLISCRDHRPSKLPLSSILFHAPPVEDDRAPADLLRDHVAVGPLELAL